MSVGGSLQGSVQASINNVSHPTVEQLKTLFIASAIPMVGFGFMDNLVMIQAGQYIDSTLGVTMGLATMTAAAAGQVVSDVSGVLFGGSLERFLHKMKLIRDAGLSMEQRRLPLCRNVSLAGAVLGVIVGCTLGAGTLLFVDLEARDRIEHASKLKEVVNDLLSVENDEGTIDCESCTIHLTHKHDFSLMPIKGQDRSRAHLGFLEDGGPLASQCARDLDVVVSHTGMKLCAPVKSSDNSLIAVLEFDDKHETGKGFTVEDQRAAKLLARHLGVFMERLTD